MSYYRDSLETYLGLTFDFIGILLEPSWDTLMSYLWVSSVLSWGLLVLLVAYLWPRKTNQSFKFLVQSQPLQSAGHLYRTTTIIAISTFQVFTWLSQSTWEKVFARIRLWFKFDPVLPYRDIGDMDAPVCFLQNNFNEYTSYLGMASYFLTWAFYLHLKLAPKKNKS